MKLLLLSATLLSALVAVRASPLPGGKSELASFIISSEKWKNGDGWRTEIKGTPIKNAQPDSGKPPRLPDRTSPHDKVKKKIEEWDDDPTKWRDHIPGQHERRASGLHTRNAIALPVKDALKKLKNSVKAIKDHQHEKYLKKQNEADGKIAHEKIKGKIMAWNDKPDEWRDNIIDDGGFSGAFDEGKKDDD